MYLIIVAKKKSGFLKNALLRRNKHKELTKSSSLRIKKEQISQPCMFKHVTALDDEFLGKTSSAETSDSEIAKVQFGSAECLPKLYDQTNAKENWPELSAEDKRKGFSRSITVDTSDPSTMKQAHSLTANQAPNVEQAKIIVQSIKNASLQRQKRIAASEETVDDTQDND